VRQAVVLAGGLATRLGARAVKSPKVLMEVADRPFADWLLERLASFGYEDIVLCIGHLGQLVREHIGDGARYGLRIRYAEDGPRPLGTGGALRAAAPLLEPAFLVTYGDSFLPFDYAEPLRVLEGCDDCDGVMSVYPNAGRWDRSNTRTDGQWVLAYEKGTTDPALDHIDYGALALRREVVLAIPEGESSDLAQVQTRLAAQHRLRAVVAAERFFEIGSEDGLTALDAHLRALRAPRKVDSP
jgi:NDP-sugar pyrophosphorylase family protein